MSRPTVALVTLGCARNEVDSEELAARLLAGGFDLVTGDQADGADAVVVNTCGFIEAAKKDSVDALLAAADLKDGEGAGPAVIAVGCMAERYGAELARELPEADAVLSFDDYAAISSIVREVISGERPEAHTPQDRRHLLPLAPVDRPAKAEVARQRLDVSPVANLKLASGCDRRCSFCAIPSFRGAFTSRRPGEVLGEARWLAEGGAREIVLVSENSTSYGKDLGEHRALEALIPPLGQVESLQRLRIAYLQPAEMRPSLIEAIAATGKAANYFDLSFQHSSPSVLRAMRRFGSTENFLDLLEQIRQAAPMAGVRSNVIVGFPGETEDDLIELETFLVAGRLDAIGVFGYSDEDGTEAVTLPGKIDPIEIAERVERISALAEELMDQRAQERIGESILVLVEEIDPQTAVITGRAEHQGPQTDGEVTIDLAGSPQAASLLATVQVGDLLPATVVANTGADLSASVDPNASVVSVPSMARSGQ